MNDKINQKTDELFNGMQLFPGKVLNEAIAKEQAKTNWWKRQAYILHLKKGTCRDCSNKEDTKNADLFFEIGGADCLDCPDGDNGKNESGEEK